MNPSTSSVVSTLAQVILLHPDDNVLVCVAAIQAGDQLSIDNEFVTATESIDVGHKLARYTLAAEEKITKYCAPVGSTIQPVKRAGHVHMHNMQSDYIPSHTRTRQNSERSES